MSLLGQLRTIPTRVGRTVHSSQRPALTADHPHAGGENCSLHPNTSALLGPSPRGWGERGFIPCDHRDGRTIPTRVGRTYVPTKRLPFEPDHPHAGGENLNITFIPSASTGPSPRGWGELVSVAKFSFNSRTIPTRVGRTSPGRIAAVLGPDHPHAGGENFRGNRLRLPFNGPSPRGWGEPATPCLMPHRPRTIPTRVGRTSGSQSVSSPQTDHPHAGGEN